MRRKQEEPKSYEEERRNRRIGQNEGLQQSSSRSVVVRLYNRSCPNRYERDLTTKPAGISSIMIVRQISQKPVRGHRFHRSHNRTDGDDIGFATPMKQWADSTMNSEQGDGQDERGVQVTTQMKWEWPLSIMKQHEDCPSAGSKGNSANERHRNAGRTVRGESREEEEQCRRRPHRNCRQSSIVVRESLNQSVDTLDTRVEATHFTPDLGVTSRYLLDNDRAGLPLDGVSPAVSQNP
ncbi:uncharacterized protein UHOD_11962 [Ustilago sp. UG-2017b]|nr:uncharacterized protein UHOD_11962 [Ustilago sp. UG-2017b]